MKHLIISISFILLNSIIAQEVNVDTVWTKTFGGSERDWGFSVQQTTDGGYIITGYKRFGNIGYDYDVWLIKTDPTGNEEWNQTFGGSGGEMGNSVQQTVDGGYIITGNTRPFGNGVASLAVNKTGNIPVSILELKKWLEMFSPDI